MKRRLVPGLPVVLLLASVGCSSAPTPEEVVEIEAPSAKSEPPPEIALSELLDKPRTELAQLAEELSGRIRFQEQSRREGRARFSLLPDFRLPLVVPVFQEARLSPLGFSLPPYADNPEKDTALALHLARYGDAKAADKLLHGASSKVRAQAEACKLERNYPVEWTRLVGLLLYEAQTRVAEGDPDGARQLCLMHQQLRALLGPKAASGPLGQALLYPGRSVLVQAGAVWRTTQQTELAELARQTLAAWGDSSVEASSPYTGQDRDELSRLLGTTETGKALTASSPARGLDLLGLPFPVQGVQSVTAFFDASDRLVEVVTTYRPRTGEAYPKPAHLALLLEDRRIKGTDILANKGLQQRNYPTGGGSWEVTTIAHGAGVGAVVRWRVEVDNPSRPVLPREVGPVHLDRSFEQNRSTFAPEIAGEVVKVTHEKALGRLPAVLGSVKPVAVVLRRVPNKNVLASVTVQYPTDDSGPPPLHELALPIWSAFGSPHLAGQEDDSTGHLALTWRDPQTRWVLRLPYDNTRPPELEIADLGAEASTLEREAQVTARDRAERAARLQAGKAQQRLPRHRESIQLGMSRSAVVESLPTGKAVIKQDFGQVFSVTYSGDPDPQARFVTRQVLVCFDEADQVHELRVRYGIGPASKPNSNWSAPLLNALKTQGGAPREIPATWATVWGQSPGRKPAAVCYLWQDDVTVVTFQRDSESVEITLRHRPPADDPAPPLSYLYRGPESCQVGMKREEILQRWNVTQPVTTADGALVLHPKAAGPYDVLMVWFDHGKASRVVARHTQTSPTGVGPAKMGPVLTAAWGRDLRLLGWPRRQDVAGGGVLRGLGWHDDVTRVRLFWQENDDGTCRVFTEWQALAQPSTSG